MRLNKLFTLFVLVLISASFTLAQTPGKRKTENETKTCEGCHEKETPGIYKQWAMSKHSDEAVMCLDCHAAEEGDKDAFMHEGELIATIVTPKDCGTCHPQEAEEVNNSYHATAGLILESKDAYLAHVGGGEPAAKTGCESCHGGKVIIDENSPNKLSAASWPNTGIGRINPDGSKGSCTACHTRHVFSKAQARQPEACGKCHLGPDHPQIEIYTESKHGNTYYTNKDLMNLKEDKWVVGDDYAVAPTCATCHMSATRNQPVTHDVGARIKWTLRPPISKTKPDWQKKRQNMKDVCATCHTPQFVNGHFVQFDALVRLYNEKFAKPATDIMKIIKKKKLREVKANFGNDIDWMYWELWHHEGRRARHGAAMMGPDYAWWHGIYDVIHNFYFEFIPEARKFHDKDVDAYIDDLFKNDPMHNWVYKTTDELKKEIRSGEMQKIYAELYKQTEK